MLEVKNLSKIYKATVKNGISTTALDNVSLVFPDKGMVFLLGKSGSGKSTLLNVCGGLDAPTSGEIIVKGKSSKNFSQSDFDSYRNTFIGFIFQEYNILNEFSVEDNIALALELQGKPKDKAAIAELLDQVDLSGFAKRKPNTLSGGQKQRIAIARALVKSPEIIMADEPTGALDSNTGKQVFDTLKKLSRDKLVIIVSHDRDFAELYGDRIIELKDGKIISDVSKEEIPQAALSDSISATGDILCVKKGATLSEEDMSKIKSFLEDAPNDVIIAKEEKSISAFKKVAHITDDGAQEYFADTDESKLEIKQYKPEDSKFIRSRLPLRHASKIGVSGLKNKPIRLLMTILLCTVAFILFGLLSTLTFYNSESMFKQTLTSSAKEYVTINKVYESNVKAYFLGSVEHQYTQTKPALFSDAEIQKLSETFGKDIFGATDSSGLEFSIRSKTASYWVNSISTAAYVPEGNAFRNKITGSYPVNDDEICISKYSAEMLIACSTTDENGNTVVATMPEDLIGKTVKISGTPYKVTGIFDCGSLDQKFDSLKDSNDSEKAATADLSTTLADGTYLMVLFTENKVSEIASFAKSNTNGVVSRPAFLNLHSPAFSADEEISKGEDFPRYSFSSIADLDSSDARFFVEGAEKLNDKEALINVNDWINCIYLYLNTHPEEFADASAEIEVRENISKYLNGLTVTFDEETGTAIETPITESEKQEAFDFLFEKFASLEINADLTPADGSNLKIANSTATYKIVGVYESSNNSQSEVYLTQNEYDKHWNVQFPTLQYCEIVTSSYKDDPNARYSTVYAPFSNTDEQKQKLWNIYSNTEFDSNSSKLSIGGSQAALLSTVDSLVKNLSTIFLYVGIVLAIFAILLFSNFITTSINQKRREIGILRAVGARGIDVFKIFFSESFVIAIICSLISTVGSMLLCNTINSAMAQEFNAAIFVFGPLSVLVIVGVAFLTAILATFIPVFIAARKKPVDSIKSI